MAEKKLYSTRFLIATLTLLSAINTAGQKTNSVFINSSDAEATIIHKAANVVPHKRQLRWQQLELTAFFHFGINTFTGKEWGNGKEDPKLFNPVAVDADQWVQVAKKAGIRQVILTAKHHDGFCLWPTSTTKHSVRYSPFENGKGDVVRAVADACKKNKIGFGIYLSPWDMNAASYGSDAYNDFFVRQLTELLTQYGRVDEVWFDGAKGEGADGKKQVYDFDRWYKVIRKLQPGAVIAIMGPDVRWVGTETGYGREMEWSVVPTNNLQPEVVSASSQQAVAFKPAGDMTGSDLGSRDKIKDARGLAWYPAETDVSIRPGWFYHPEEDNQVKTPANLLDIYYNSVGRNGVLLLNIPPDTKGRIHDADARSLLEWKKMRDEEFKINLATAARISAANGIGAPNLLDKKYATFFTTKGKDTTTVIDFALPAPKTFNVLLLQEDIRQGQRVEKFILEYLEAGVWKTAADGSTIGYKRLLRFPAVTSGNVRLRILSSRLNPFIAEFALYKQVKSNQVK